MLNCVSAAEIYSILYSTDCFSDLQDQNANRDLFCCKAALKKKKTWFSWGQFSVDSVQFKNCVKIINYESTSIQLQNSPVENSDVLIQLSSVLIQ